MKILKRLLGIILVAVLSIVHFVPAKAEKVGNFQNTSMDALVTSEICSYLHSNNLHADYLSQAIPVWNADDDSIKQYIYFVFDKEQSIGYMSVYGNTKYQLNFINSNVSVKNGESIQLLYKDEELLILSSEGARHLAGEYNDYINADFSDDKQCVVERSIEIQDQQQTRINPTVYQLLLPYVANSTVDGVGICWAACIASRVNYEKGKSLTAKQVYNKCNNATS